jgi:purine-nucleoside phosphorylase
MIRQPVPARLAAQDPYRQAHTAARHLRDLTGGSSHQIAVILGSGWASAAGCLGTADYETCLSELPGFVPASAPGHAGTVRSVTVTGSGKRALVFAGRTHLYEGHGAAQSVHAVRTAISAGCGVVVLTNGAGGIRPGFRPGQLVLISDHINLTACSPLTGPRFTDLTDVYSPRLRALCRQVQPGITDGVYLQLPGPHYETPAEIRMARILGADLVGMSTALETIAARELGAEVLGIPLVTNLAAGLAGEPINSHHIHDVSNAARARIGSLLRETITRI